MTQFQRIAISPNQLQNGLISLTNDQLHYLVRVLRLRDGDKFIAIDGTGRWWLTVLQGESGQVLESLEIQTELPVSVTLLLALPKGSGFDDIVRVATELGVVKIVPVLSERTLLNPSPQKLERWRRIAQEASEQSERAIVPTILAPVTFNTALSSLTAEQKFICEGRGDNPHLLNSLNPTFRTISIAVGPEGGWTNHELQEAIEMGYQPVSLGRRILRAITAPIVALSLISARYEV